LQPGFGAAFIPLFALALPVAARQVTREYWRRVAWGLILVAGGLNFVEKVYALPSEVQDMHLRWELASNYIHEISQSTASTIFTFEDATAGFTSNQFVAEFADFHGQLIRVSDLDWWPGCRFYPKIQFETDSNHEATIESQIDSTCAGHNFGGIWILKHGGGNTFTRKVGDTTLIYHLSATTSEDFFLSGQLKVKILNAPPSSMILFPELDRKRYGQAWLSPDINPVKPPGAPHS
jgi:hypothetical protein